MPGTLLRRRRERRRPRGEFFIDLMGFLWGESTDAGASWWLCSKNKLTWRNKTKTATWEKQSNASRGKKKEQGKLEKLNTVIQESDRVTLTWHSHDHRTTASGTGWLEKFIDGRNGANLLSAIYRGVVFFFVFFFTCCVLFFLADRKWKKVLFVCLPFFFWLLAMLH